MKQTSFTVKDWGGNLPRKQNQSLDSTVSVDELTVEICYHFKTSEFSNTLHPQSQLEPPINFKNLLKVFFTVASLWWLLWL